MNLLGNVRSTLPIKPLKLHNAIVNPAGFTTLNVMGT